MSSNEVFDRLLAQRAEAKTARNQGAMDAIKAQLKDMGCDVIDTAGGQIASRGTAADLSKLSAISVALRRDVEVIKTALLAITSADENGRVSFDRQSLAKTIDLIGQHATFGAKASTKGKLGISGAFQFRDKDGQIVQVMEINGSIPLDRVMEMGREHLLKGASHGTDDR